MMHCQALALLGVLGALPNALCSPLIARTSSEPMIYNWTDITPSADLKWTPCFDNYTCARLEVPLDYTDLTAGTTAIAYIKLSAAQQPAEDVLINPGGPGGSGVDALLGLGSRISQLVGEQYNIVGFDPRGVNNSGPALTCFGDDKIAEAVFRTQYKRTFDSKSPYSMSHLYETAGAYGEFCSKKNEGSDAKFANTIAVANDMLNYAEKRKLALGEDPKDGKLYYYGVSYGTVLGATYASLFPDRIGRMVLDGVADAENYYQGAWSANSYDADAAIEDYFRFCFEAGPELCAFWDNSTAAIATRTRNVLEAVREAPVPVGDPAIVQYPLLVSYEDLDFLLLWFTYLPLVNFPVLAQIFADLEQRNGTLAAAILQDAPPTATSAGGLIGAIDAAGRYDLSTFEKWEKHVEEFGKQTKWVGDAWAPIALVGRNMTISPPPSQQFNGTPSAAKTSSPILFVSNTHDPATPLIGAHKMSALFPGSAVLIQDAPGHVAGFSALSNCTLGYFNEYFASATLPPQNTTCKVDSVPFLTLP